MKITEAICITLLIILCTPLGWIGMFLLALLLRASQ
jgi:hypothetical protein